MKGIGFPAHTWRNSQKGVRFRILLGGHTQLNESAKIKDVTPEGSRIVEIRKFFINIEIQPLRTVQDQETDGDIIVFRNKEYRIYIVEEYRNFVVAYGIIEERIPE